MKRYLKTEEEVTQALREGKTVQTNEMEYDIINNLIVGFDKIVREISINPAIRLSENPYVNEYEQLKLEVGKFYKTRDGRKVIILAYYCEEKVYPYLVARIGVWEAPYRARKNGCLDEKEADAWDIVAPWEE